MAVAAALNMLEPTSTGIGGDIFCIFYHARDKTVRAINGSGRSSANVDRDDICRQLGLPHDTRARIPSTSALSVTVPGAAAGWIDTIESFGSGKLSLQQILDPAIAMGENGFVVSETAAAHWRQGEPRLKRASANFAEILKADISADRGHRAPSSGEIMRNPALAMTFRALAQKGKAGFYTGRVAAAIVEVLSEQGSSLSLLDLANHMHDTKVHLDPIGMTFPKQAQQVSSDHIKLWESPPNGQGMISLMVLGMLKILEKQGRVKVKAFSSDDHNSVEYIHVLVELLRIAFADANWFVADPEVVHVPVERLLSEAYLTERAALFKAEHAADIPHHGSPALNACDTVYFAASDVDGNAISFINSNYMGFGSAIVPKGCGFTLQNRGTGFVLGPQDHPNILAPSKRPYHTIIPAMVTNDSDGSLYASLGSWVALCSHKDKSKSCSTC